MCAFAQTEVLIVIWGLVFLNTLGVGIGTRMVLDRPPGLLLPLALVVALVVAAIGLLLLIDGIRSRMRR